MMHREVSMVPVDGGPECNQTRWECPICKRVYVQMHEHEGGKQQPEPKPCDRERAGWRGKDVV